MINIIIIVIKCNYTTYKKEEWTSEICYVRVRRQTLFYLAGKIQIGRSVKMSGFFIAGRAVGLLLKIKNATTFRVTVKKSPALNVLKN